jgi:YidC/Oxa1 family membrane protein insertase
MNIWHDFLYAPLLNVLIYLYNGIAGQNLGVAVIFLTIALRIALLPFTVASVRNEEVYEQMNKKVEVIKKAFKNDPVMQRQEIREFLRKNSIHPWAKAIVLGVQVLVLVLLYQVFLGGINYTKLTELYSWVVRPDFVNTGFLGFDIGERRSLLWPALVGIVLYFEIHFEQRKRKSTLLGSDIVYKYFFPFFSFLALYILPIAKSIFILTSLVFSITMGWTLRKIFHGREPAIN